MNIKNKNEIKIMSESGKILAKVLKQIKGKIKPDISTWQLDQYAERLILEYNAKPAFKGFKNYPNTTCISINNEIVHGLPSKKKIIKSGDIVSVDCGVLYKKYNSDAAFTVGVEKISLDAEKLIKTTKKSLDLAIKKIKPGIKMQDIQRIIQTTIEGAGFSVIRRLSGHGIGISVHESPPIYNFVGQGPNITLEAGMTFCLEPMAAVGTYRVKTKNDGWTIASSDGSLTAHFEHTIAVTENGYKILTHV